PANTEQIARIKLGDTVVPHDRCARTAIPEFSLSVPSERGSKLEKRVDACNEVFDLERPGEEDISTQARGFDEAEAGPSSHTTFQNCKISTKSGYDEEMEVDLTLSIGGSQVKKSHLPCLNSTNNEKTRKFNSLKSDRIGECCNPTTPLNSSTVTFTQERKGLRKCGSTPIHHTSSKACMRESPPLHNKVLKGFQLPKKVASGHEDKDLRRTAKKGRLQGQRQRLEKDGQKKSPLGMKTKT
ncbi:hypothetical protein CR513_41902, partial [Mucuna pruriens]